MVLILRRAASVALMSLLSVPFVRAQRGPTDIRISDRPVLFGFALSCVECAPGQGGRGRAGGGGRANDVPVWLYRRFPLVEDVIPSSPAENAGIRVGDVLKAIDGLSLLTEEGTRRMSSATAGETVRLTFERNSKTFDLPLTIGPAGGGRGPNGRELIVTGHMVARMPTAHGDIEIDVWTDDAVRMRQDSTGAMVLRLGDAILRLRIPEALRDTIGNGRGVERGRGKPEPHTENVPRSR